MIEAFALEKNCREEFLPTLSRWKITMTKRESCLLKTERTEEILIFFLLFFQCNVDNVFFVTLFGLD